METASFQHKLTEIAEQNGVNLNKIQEVWNNLPAEDSEDFTYLEAANRCIIEVSELIDDVFYNVTQKQRAVKKYRLFAQLLELKSQDLEDSI